VCSSDLRRVNLLGARVLAIFREHRRARTTA